MHLTAATQQAQAGRALADLILSSADAQRLFSWAQAAELGEVFIDGELLEPIPVGEAQESDFAAFEDALS